MAKYVKAALRVLAYVLCIFIPYGIDHSITVFTDDPCKPRTMESSGIEGRVETAIYEVVTRSGFRDIRSRYTAVITLRDYELPLELFSDKCKQREFLSTIIRKAADAGASMIVIDKYFSPGSCKDATATGTLAKAIE